MLFLNCSALRRKWLELLENWRKQTDLDRRAKIAFLKELEELMLSLILPGATASCLVFYWERWLEEKESRWHLKAERRHVFRKRKLFFGGRSLIGP